MIEKAHIVFESYNIVVEASYEKAFINKKPDEILKMNESSILEFLQKDIEMWYDVPLDELQGITPRSFFSAVADIEEAMQLFAEGARLCDRELPDLLLEKLLSFEETAVNRMLELVMDAGMRNSVEDFYVPLTVVRTFGKWKTAKAVDNLIDVLYECGEQNEVFTEEITDALISIGMPAADRLLRILEASETIGYTDEYALSALVKIGKDSKSDTIFKCLKDTFRKMEDKVLGAMCLGDYGDSRAIPLLRGYVQRNKGNMDKMVYREALAAIKRLGGEIDDLIS